MESGASQVIVATDHSGVADAVKAVGGDVCMTRIDHHSGTERLAEVIDHYDFSDETVIVNVQGDEPLIPSAIIHQVAKNLMHASVNMATLAVPIKSAKEAFDPNVVKVVKDAQGYAMYFSRATIPWDRERFKQSQTPLSHSLLRHIGLYAYRAGFIRRYVRWQPSPPEQIEHLEQLRVLWYGEKIHVGVADEFPSISVDTPDDLQRVRALMQ